MKFLVSRIVEKLANYLTGLDCGGRAVGHMLDEDVGDGVAELASGERADGDSFLSWSCCDRFKSRPQIVCLGRTWLHASVVIYPLVTADTAKLAALVAGCCLFCR